ncbi:MAG: error-prone DNA polymerase [Porticoccaceae bacterium]|jgi:error-prone DNA polymerase|nr:error-prone DNA polymerase [Alphaproteobacteria bacterium]MDP4746166.1 error-prone DNA polymerase [Porticoccaceae bacterium]MDP4752841.1 error-prone DNA polymerase [Porticoccaceae bacterium]MDP4889667.1 error-prone DNA polymerase [Porticoccaceae bacterium]
MPYAELHCVTNFSFLRGASHPHELVQRAAELGYQALAITDECSLAGVVKAHVAALEHDLQLIIGSEFKLDGQRLLVLVPNRQAYAELSALITLARRRSEKGDYRLEWCDLQSNLRNGLIIWLPSGDLAKDQQHGAWLSEWFLGRLWVGVEHLLYGNDSQQYYYYRNLAAMWQLPMLACGDVHMHSAERQPLQDVLTAIHHGCSVMSLGARRFANAERHLRRLDQLQKLYPPALLAETLVVARRCHFSLQELRYEYPADVVPPNVTASQQLRFLVGEGLLKRWPQGASAEVHRQIDYELQVIAELQYESYFLTVHDIVHFARSRNILCQGRGSAANSIVCYCLLITEVSPDQISMLFERFISRERNEPPDIDVDFEHERREEVIQYIYKKYGRERAALAATVITYRPRSAVRDVGKALGLDALFIEQLSQSMSWWQRQADLEALFQQQGFSNRGQLAKYFFTLLQDIIGFPRHLSQHVGGFIITKSPISSLVPVENASMAERTVIQWDKYDIEALGLLKIDILALGMLSAIRRCFDLLRAQQSTDLDMQAIPKNDSATYDMLCQADSVGVFQIESRAQMAMLPRLKPRCFYDLVIEIAIVRPGPIQGGMVHPYLRRRQGLEAVDYPSQEIQSVLERTLGIPVFQEQVIRLAMVAAGFTGGEADQLRRAMASWGKDSALIGFQQKLITGMLARGYSLDFAQRLFKQIQGFGVYGFPESHSASFALLAYVSAWLKCHYPAAYCCALLNSQPMGFYSPSQLIQDVKRHDVEVYPIDVLYSDWDHRLEAGAAQNSQQPAIRLGLRLIKGFSRVVAERIVAVRTQVIPQSLTQLAHAAQLSQAHLSLLSSAGALGSLSNNRRQAHWDALAVNDLRPLLIAGQSDTPLDAVDGGAKHSVILAAPSEVEIIGADYSATGVSLGRHPMAILRERIELIQRCKRQSDLASMGHKRFIRVAGLVTGRQRPGTASGVIFLTLEDETGNINVVVWTSVQERCREALLKGRLLVVKGVLETDGSVVHVIAQELIDCSEWLLQT